MTLGQNHTQERPLTAATTTAPEEAEPVTAFEEVISSPVTTPSELLANSSAASATSSIVDCPALAAARTRAALGTKRKVEPLESLLVSGSGKRKMLRDATPEPLMPIPHRLAVLPYLDDENKRTLSSLTTNHPRNKVEQNKSLSLATGRETEGFSFTIKPVMGAPFEVTLSQDANVFDLKDAILRRTGIVPDMQLIGMDGRGTSLFALEEEFLGDLPIVTPCTLSLSVKAITGIPTVNECTSNTEEIMFIYEFLAPTRALESSSSSSTSEGDDDDDDDDDDSNNSDDNEEDNTPGVEAIKDSPKIIVGVPTSLIPRQVLQSYRFPNVSDNNSSGTNEGIEGDLLFAQMKELESLRISTDVEALPRKEADSTMKEANSTIINPSQDNTIVRPATEAARCTECGRRCRLATQFTCRCGNIYCGEHRYFDKHKCTFDHKANDRARLDVNNPRFPKSSLRTS